jgi:hypothetical protein
MKSWRCLTISLALLVAGLVSVWSPPVATAELKDGGQVDSSAGAGGDGKQYTVEIKVVIRSWRGRRWWGLV